MPAKKVWGDFQLVRVDSDGLTWWQCPYCPFQPHAPSADAVNKKSNSCAQHFWGANPCTFRPDTDRRGIPKSASVSEVDATPNSNIPVCVPVSNDSAVLVQTLREQMEQKDRHHAEKMEQQRLQYEQQMEQKDRHQRELMQELKQSEEKKDSWKRVCRKRFFTIDGIPSSPPNSSDGEEEKHAKMEKLCEEDVLHGRIGAFESVSESVGMRKRKRDEAPSAYERKVTTDLKRKERAAEKLHEENTKMKSRFARDIGDTAKKLPRVARSVKVLANDLPEGGAKEIMKKAVPNSGNGFDRSWSSSGTQF